MTLLPKSPNGRGTALEQRYMSWLHDDLPCCLSARTDAVQAAHISTVADGKGMGFKGPLPLILPLQHALHLSEEHSRRRFWQNAFPEDPRPWAERLYEIFAFGADRAEAEALLADMHAMADLGYLAMILRKAA